MTNPLATPPQETSHYPAHNPDSPVPQQTLTIAVVGDVHNQWTPDDASALYGLGVDLVLFVGDFGNEAVEIVRAIASLDLPKAVILGNHDAWYTASSWGRQQSPYNHQHEDRVQQQLDLLGTAHVGYRCLNFPDLGVSVTGARPFSWGGSVWKNTEFYQQRFGVDGFAVSTDKIVAAASQATENMLIVLGHNGPKGLGDRPEDPCGKDWQPVGGDHGDVDFAQAIAQIRTNNIPIHLVVFGHMHHKLRHSPQPRLAVYQDSWHTLYLNAACVPRIITTATESRHNFSLVSVHGGQITAIRLVWANAQGQILTEQSLYPSISCRHECT